VRALSAREQAAALNHLLVTLLVSPVLLPKAALKHVSPQMLHSRFEPLFSLLYILRQSICSNRDCIRIATDVAVDCVSKKIGLCCTIFTITQVRLTSMQ
jgi:hypothetical protein